MSIVKAKFAGQVILYEAYSRQEEGVNRGDLGYIMSRSELTEFALNPRRWKDGYGLEKKDTKSTLWGSLIDCLLTSPNTFASRYAVSPETYFSEKMKCPKCGSITDAKSCRACKCDREKFIAEKPWDAKAGQCQEWEEGEEKTGHIVIKSELKKQADLAVAAIRSNPVTEELFSTSDCQVMIVGFWHDEATNLEIPIRCLIDLVPPVSGQHGKKIGDFKTARDGNPEKWARVVNDEGYDVQAALIMDLYKAARPDEDRVDFIHIIQENVFPFHVVSPIPALSAEFLEWGRAKYKAALRTYCQCIATGIWPSYKPVGMPFGQTQIISPDTLWVYRETAGMVDGPQPQTPYREEPETSDNPDVGN